MAEFSEKYSKIIKDIEKSISDEKEREIVLKKVSELSFMYMDVIDRISNVNSERMDDIEKHQDKLDEKIGKIKETVDLIKKDIYEDEDYDFEIVCPYCNHEFVADIEDELNGLYTFDREICKVNKEGMKQIRAKIDQEMENISSTL